MKEFTTEMKEIYTSVNRDQAAMVLFHFEQKRGSKYRMLSKAGAVIGMIWQPFLTSLLKSEQLYTPPI